MKEKSILSQIGNMPISAKQLDRIGVSRNDLKSLLEDNKLLRLGRGVYQLVSSDLGDESLFRAATLRIQGPSAVCLISALAFYNLADEIPKKTWLLVDVNRKTYLKDIRLFRSHNPHWKVGITEEKGYHITSLDRTIVDCLTYQAKLGNVGITALKRALKSKQTTLTKIANMADQLEVPHRIAPYIRVLL